MASRADVRRIALSFPDTGEEPGRFAFFVLNKGKKKGFAWVWMERVHPKKPRVPQPKALAIRTASLDDREFLLASSKTKFFTEPHYQGYPAVLVWLAEVTVPELRSLLTEAWRSRAPKGLEPDTKPARAGRPRVR